MSRLTSRDKHENGIWAKEQGGNSTFYEPYDEGYLAVAKLAHYEDFEEQLMKSAEIDIDSMIGEFMHYYKLKKEGRLIELPCKVGDTVYVPTTKCAVEDYPIGRDWDCDGCDYEEQFIIAERPFTYDKIEYIGKVYFLTKEEAKARLAELKGGGKHDD